MAGPAAPMPPLAALPISWAGRPGDAGPVGAAWPGRRADPQSGAARAGHCQAVAHTSPARTSVLVVAFPGGAGTASLVQQARRMATRSPVPLAVVEVSPSAGLWAVPAAVAPLLMASPRCSGLAPMPPIHSPRTAMPVLTPIPTEVSSARVAAAPDPAGPACSLQRSGSLWQLGIEAQELTTAIGLLAEQLEADDDDTRAQALAELEAALLAEEGNKAALAAKADATCWVIEHLRGQAAYRQQQAKRLTELSRSDAGRADALEESLVLVLTRLQPTATRFSFPNHELTSRKSQAVEIDDEDALALSGSPSRPPASRTRPPSRKPSRPRSQAPSYPRRSWRIH